MSGAGWMSYLQPATWRGLTFQVYTSSVTAGRKQADHDYPFRDDTWIEDIGLKAREFSFHGFILGDDCFAREFDFIQAAEQRGPGVLVHPTLGTQNVSLKGFSSGQDFERGRMVVLDFRFKKGVSSPVYPSTTVSTGDAVDNAADGADDAAAADFDDDVAAPADFGDQVTAACIAAVSGFVDGVNTALEDSGLIAGSVAALVPPLGFTFGRYASGGLSVLDGGVLTVSAALANVTAQIAVVQGLGATAEALSAAITPAIPPGMQALTEGLRQSSISPAEQLRLLSTLAQYAPSVPSSYAPIGNAIWQITNALSALCRRAALTSLARASASYQPSSYNDAVALRQSTAALLDAEILIAADNDDVATYQALRALRSAVVVDLNTRAATLPALKEVVTPASQPAPLIAWRLYSDGARIDDLIARADPIHPAFMPLAFVALSA